MKIMSIKTLTLLSLLLPSLFLVTTPCRATAAKKGTLISDIKMAQDLNNNVISFPNKSGKWTVLNYWAQWCGPCQREIPDLNAFYKNNQSKIVLVGINSDLLDPKTLQKVSKDLKIQFPILKTDPLKVVDSLVGMPSTYFISPEGKVHGPLLGPQSEESILKAIQKFS